MSWEKILKRTYGRLDETGYSPYNEERSLRTESPPEEESGDDARDIVDDPEEWIRQQKEIPSRKNTSEREERGLYNYAAEATDGPIKIIEDIESLIRQIDSGKKLKFKGRNLVDNRAIRIYSAKRNLDTIEYDELGFKWWQDEMYDEYTNNSRKLIEAVKRLDSIIDKAR
tara:strand:- start:4044 stop:4553 length:510 start_codon:yes stop_codon:yes gene_type:complete